MAGLALSILVGAYLAGTALTGIRTSAREYRAGLRQTVAHLVRSDTESARNSLLQVRQHLDNALADANSPALRLAVGLPVLGGDVQVALAGVETASDITAALELVVDRLSTLPEPLYANGAIDAAAATRWATVWGEAEARLELAVDRMESAPVPRLQEVAEAADEVTQRARQGVVATRALRLLLERVTGWRSSGVPFRLLVVIANGAELRATLGMPVFLARLDLGENIEVSYFPPSATQQSAEVAAPEEFMALFGPLAGSPRWSNLTMSRDGPTVGRVAADIHAQVEGRQPDLVVVLDFVTAGLVLDSFSGIEVEGEPWEAKSLATDFLVDSYRRYPDEAERDRYLLAVFREVFDQLPARDLSGERLVKAVQGAAQQGRAVAWSPHPDIQAGVDLAGLAGRLEGGSDRVDVAVQSFGAGERDLFTTLDADLETAAVGCALHHRLTVEISDRTPLPLRTLPSFGAGENRWWVNAYLPPGSQVQELYANGEAAGGSEGTWGRLPVASLFTTAPFPGTGTVAVEWAGSPPESGTMTVSLGATVRQAAQELVFELPPGPGCG